MPCYTITTVKLVLTNANLDLLKKALEGIGYTAVKYGDKLFWKNGSYDKTKGTLSLVKGTEEQGNVIRRAYSTEVLKKNAAKFGWQLKKTQDNKYQLLKR